MSATTGMRVTDVAAAAHVSTDTVRYYERVGLLPPAERTASGYRTFGPAAVDRLRFIQGAQRLGLRLREIGELLAVRDTGACPCEPAEDLLYRRRTEIDTEIARLNALRAEISRMLTAIPADDCPDPTPGTWCPQEGGEPACATC
ncbi:MAG TPA: heavy metal-responsive transcriptional regulator [Planosporangium sp.]|jgi:DNA-binding transcriptional MerR regulator|nr:heavy metal-responsive transcriptional regulator [Planosporangium sp.]